MGHLFNGSLQDIRVRFNAEMPWGRVALFLGWGSSKSCAVPGRLPSSVPPITFCLREHPAELNDVFVFTELDMMTSVSVRGYGPVVSLGLSFASLVTLIFSQAKQYARSRAQLSSSPMITRALFWYLVHSLGGTRQPPVLRGRRIPRTSKLPWHGKQ